MGRVETQEGRQTAIFRPCRSGPASGKGGGYSVLWEARGGGSTFVVLALLSSDKCPGRGAGLKRRQGGEAFEGQGRRGRAGFHGLKNCRLLTRCGQVSKSTKLTKNTVIISTQ